VVRVQGEGGFITTVGKTQDLNASESREVEDALC
jgi:hypothetical protein